MKPLFMGWLLANLFQLIVAAGLLFLAYGATPGLAKIAADGEALVSQLAALEQRSETQQSKEAGGLNRVRPVLMANSQALRQLSETLGISGLVLFLCTVAQFALLIMLRRSLAAAQRAPVRASAH